MSGLRQTVEQPHILPDCYANIDCLLYILMQSFVVASSWYEIRAVYSARASQIV